jgi:hypothetical protein
VPPRRAPTTKRRASRMRQRRSMTGWARTTERPLTARRANDIAQRRPLVACRLTVRGQRAAPKGRRSSGPAARVASGKGALVQASAEVAGDVVMARHRDRLGVPEGLADALGSLLVLYAVGDAMGAEP